MKNESGCSGSQPEYEKGLFGMHTKKGIITQKLNQLLEMQRQCEKIYGVKKWDTLEELNQLAEKAHALSLQVVPAELWFQAEQHSYILDLLDEVQTKIEDRIKARKRIAKVWSEEIYLPHNVRFVNEYVTAIGSKKKYFSVQFWNHKKALQGLFLESLDLFTDNEIKVLKKNLIISEECQHWLFFNKKKIKQVLAKNYMEDKTDFIETRKTFQLFCSFYEEEVKDSKKFTYQNYNDFLQWILKIEGNLPELYRDLAELLKEKPKTEWIHSKVNKIIRECKESIKAVPSRTEACAKYGFSLWNPDECQKNIVNDFFVPELGVRRNVDGVSNDEWMYGILKMIEMEEEISLEDMERIMAELLNYAKRTSKLNSKMEYMVRELKKQGKIKRFSGGWRLA